MGRNRAFFTPFESIENIDKKTQSLFFAKRHKSQKKQIKEK